MSDLIERLRDQDYPGQLEMRREAADEIERLKEIADTNYVKWREQTDRIAELLAEIERLRAVVDAAIAWANTDQNDIVCCNKTDRELLDAVTDYEMSIAAVKESACPHYKVTSASGRPICRECHEYLEEKP